MGKIPDKLILHYDGVTLTGTPSAAGVTNNIDTTGFDEATIYIDYTPAVTGEVLTTGIEFSNDGTNFYPETDETVSGGVATAIPKTRVFTSTVVAAGLNRVPVISMPIADKRMRILVSDDVGTTGTVTINVRLSTIKK